MRALVILLIACGGGKAPPPPAPSGSPAPTEAPPAKGDVQVASVNDRPVWGSCVTAQAARGRGGVTREQALEQCIEFELLAQVAEIRDLALDPEVAIATRTALVSQLVAYEYEDKYNRPEDFGPFWHKRLEQNRWRFDHDELRGSVYVRALLPQNAAPADAARAKQVIDEIYTALKDERGLMKPHVDAIAQRVAAGRVQLEIAPAQQQVKLWFDEPYGNALFSIAEIGRAAPPVRTKWGWDVVVLDSIVPARKATPDEVVAEALPEIRRLFFPQWVNMVIAGLGVRIEVIADNLSLLEDL